METVYLAAWLPIAGIVLALIVGPDTRWDCSGCDGD